MPRDYAKARYSRSRHASAPPSRLRWLLLGLVFGLILATFNSWKDVLVHAVMARRVAMHNHTGLKTQNVAGKAHTSAHHTRFDFYTELPKMKVPVGTNAVVKPMQVHTLPEVPTKPLDQVERHLLNQNEVTAPSINVAGTASVLPVAATPVPSVEPSTPTIKAEKVPEAPPIKAESSYRVIVGSFDRQETADADRAALMMQGLEPQVSQEGSHFLLWFGPYPSVSDANAVAQDLKKLNYNPKVVS